MSRPDSTATIQRHCRSGALTPLAPRENSLL
jgi:hypothetical protein